MVPRMSCAASFSTISFALAEVQTRPLYEPGTEPESNASKQRKLQQLY